MIHAKPVLSEVEGALRREEFSEKVFRAEAQRRGDVVLAAQRLSNPPGLRKLFAAYAEASSEQFSSTPLRLCAQTFLLNLFAPSRPLGFAQDRLRVNQNFSGTPHV